MTERTDCRVSEGFEFYEDGVVSLSFRPWRSCLIQGVTLRRLSNKAEDSFDLGKENESSSGTTGGNWDLFTESVCSTKSLLVRMEQVHGREIEAIGSPSGDAGSGANRTITIRERDGLITNSSDTVLTASVADCVPTFLYDAKRNAIGLLHAGWRGTAAEIVRTGINRMTSEYGAAARDLVIYMGPSICRDCYPVSDDVHKALESWVGGGEIKQNGLGIDLRDINRRQAIEEGVREENIFQSAYCSHCSKGLFFSYRASKGSCGRMVAFLALRK